MRTGLAVRLSWSHGQPAYQQEDQQLLPSLARACAFESLSNRIAYNTHVNGADSQKVGSQNF